MQLYLHVGMFVVNYSSEWKVSWKERLMQLHLQFGYGMMEHCRHLIESWGGGVAILSPRDLNDNQLHKLSSNIRELEGGQVLLDPQFYLPHADHARLCQHSYWPSNYDTNAFWQGPALADLLNSLNVLNDSLGTQAFILPGLLAESIDSDWLETQRAVLSEAASIATDKEKYLTLALGADAARNNDQVALLLEESETWEPAGYYLVFEHPNGEYLVDDVNWLANVLDIIAGFRLRGKKVILGYSNHQSLITACAKPTAVCSGTWMNVRSFPPDKFRNSYDEEIKQRATWYYCPQSFSEYKIPSLDLALRQRVLEQLRPQGPLDNAYISALFSGMQPTSVGFTEQSAFRHYLHCLRIQSETSVKATFDETVSSYSQALDLAEGACRALHAVGVIGQQRDFRNFVDVNRGALNAFVATRGPMLRRRWSSL